jgi:hypothetical protein
LHPLCHSHYSSSQRQWHSALLQAYHIQPERKEINSQPIIACNTPNNAYQPAQLFLLSTEVVEDTPVGKVGCPSDKTTNQDIRAVLALHTTDLLLLKLKLVSIYA